MSLHLIIVLLLSPFLLFGQDKTAQDQAMALAKEAVILMDNGDVNQAVKLLKKARNMDENNYVYTYEIGYAYYLQKDYSKSIKAFESTLKYKNAPDECYQMLGNVLCHSNQKKRAQEVYLEGLEKHPKSGKILVELGALALENGQFGQAVAYWEKGIEVAPLYAPNYFHAVLHYQKEFYPVRAIIYGEIYRHLDRSSEQSEEMSKILYLAYEKIDKSSNYRDLVDKNSTVGEMAPFDLSIISNIRPFFMEAVKNSDAFKYNDDEFFDYQQAIEKAGLTDAYVHWMMMKGNEFDFVNWFAKNEEQFNQLSDWFLENKLELEISPVFKE